MTEPTTEPTKAIDAMTKDELYEFALSKGVELDRAKMKRDEMIAKCLKLQDGTPGDGDDNPTPPETPEPPPAKSAAKKAEKADTQKYLRHPANGRVYVATDHLMKRGDMLPCDKSGRLI